MPNEFQPSGAYNFYDWKTYEDKENQNLMNVYRNAGRFGNQLTDFTSPFYQQFRSWMGSMTPTLGTNAMLAPLMAGGGNMGAAQAQANILHKNYLGQRNDFLNRGVQGFAQNNMNMLPQLLNIQAGVGSNILNARTQKEISGDQQGGILDFLGTGLGAGLAFLPQLLSGAFGGGTATAMMAAPAAMSDIRFKENISYTGEETKDGIPIVEFNYINDDVRYRGVIAQDAEEIRPDAVTEINGYKYVYYGVL